MHTLLIREERIVVKWTYAYFNGHMKRHEMDPLNW